MDENDLIKKVFPSASVIYDKEGEISMMNDPLEHASGIERREVLAKAAGNDNPFDIKVFKRGAGTKENPNLIPSTFDERIVGCICEEDQTYVQWMWLQKGTLKRCECGHWFKLVEKAPV
ncbi:cytochrome c oxidase subunit 5B, mitochondrial-like [Eurosta solidaginis]|uniref:cytochrome c oxidase subunit 5B, mitochondrial-like n=1 Tax=Eurosta solidaginis TaxID=178769 RepID=UPI003530EBDF